MPAISIQRALGTFSRLVNLSDPRSKSVHGLSEEILTFRICLLAKKTGRRDLWYNCPLVDIRWAIDLNGHSIILH